MRSRSDAEMRMKLWSSPSQTRPRGSASRSSWHTRLRSLAVSTLLVSGCVTYSGGPAAVPGDPFYSDSSRIQEYVWCLGDPACEPNTRAMRAWVREADKTIRANNEIYGIAPDTEEDLPWVVRVWHSFLRLFTVR